MPDVWVPVPGSREGLCRLLLGLQLRSITHRLLGEERGTDARQLVPNRSHSFEGHEKILALCKPHHASAAYHHTDVRGSDVVEVYAPSPRGA